MTLFEFKLLDQNEQAVALWDRGVLLDTQVEKNLRMILYRIDNFYIEVIYQSMQNKMIKIRSFSSDTLLQPYLDQIDLSDLNNHLN